MSEIISLVKVLCGPIKKAGAGKYILQIGHFQPICMHGAGIPLLYLIRLGASKILETTRTALRRTPFQAIFCLRYVYGEKWQLIYKDCNA